MKHCVKSLALLLISCLLIGISTASIALANRAPEPSIYLMGEASNSINTLMEDNASKKQAALLEIYFNQTEQLIDEQLGGGFF